MEDIKEDAIANKILERLPPPFTVFGKQKDLNPLEEFWMNKLTAIENQYDLHIVDLERKLLNEKQTRRSIKKQSGKISKLEESLSEQTTLLDRATSTSKKLQGKLKEKEYEAKSLNKKLERSTIVQLNIQKRMEDERRARIEYEKECAELKNRLKKMEKERSQLCLDVEIKESEKKRVEERESLANKERWSFVKNLTDIDTERRIQTNANVKLCEDIEKLFGIEKSLEMSLLKERRIMGELMEEMRVQKEEHKNALRHLDLAIKEKNNVGEALEHSLLKIMDKDKDVKGVKDELYSKEAENMAKAQEIKDLKRRNSRIRCVLADTRHKLNGCLSEMKSLQNEKRRADVELESARKHEESLQLEIKKNQLRKYKLAEKILKSHPFLMLNKKGESESRKSSSFGSSSLQVRNEIESYKKQIWKLERNKNTVDRKLSELQRKENIYRLKLNKLGEMEQQIFWTGKAMAKLEGDRERLESMLKNMESNMPVKVPFQKLVTDPSVLDRLVKNKVLQKRLFRQTEKMEELKKNAKRILQFREKEFGVGGQYYQEEIPTWKMSYWNKQAFAPEGILAGLDIDFERRKKGNLSLMSFTDDSNYKSYLNYLDEEIPKLKDEIDHLERKKLFIEIEKESEEGKKKKAEAVASERKKILGALLDDERLGEDPLEAILEGVGDEDEDGGSGGGQATPELSMHGSSYNEANAGVDTGLETKKESLSSKKVSKKNKTLKKGQKVGNDESLTDDDRNDDERSSEGATDIPSD